jgi:hypothetical protein
MAGSVVIEGNRAAVLLERLLTGLEDAQDAHAAFGVSQGWTAGLDALDKMFALAPERFVAKQFNGLMTVLS